MPLRRLVPALALIVASCGAKKRKDPSESAASEARSTRQLGLDTLRDIGSALEPLYQRGPSAFAAASDRARAEADAVAGALKEGGKRGAPPGEIRQWAESWIDIHSRLAALLKENEDFDTSREQRTRNLQS